VPLGYTLLIVRTYKKLLRECEDGEAVEKLKALETSFYQRKLLLKKIRKRLRRKILNEIAPK
jgi:hypothetical protein